MTNQIKCIIGIDVGLTGAIAVYDVSTNQMAVHDIPTIKANKKSVYDVPNLITLLRKPLNQFSASNISVALESQQAMPQQGVRSTFSIGYGFGLLHGATEGLGYSVSLVRPKAWQKDIFIDTEDISLLRQEAKQYKPKSKEKKSINNKIRRLRKRLSIDTAKESYPYLAEQLSRVSDDGRADAINIANWHYEKIFKKSEKKSKRLKGI